MHTITRTSRREQPGAVGVDRSRPGLPRWSGTTRSAAPGDVEHHRVRRPGPGQVLLRRREGAAGGARPVTDPVTAYFAAVNAEDWAALARLWEPDAELIATGARPRHGREAIAAYYPRVLAGYAEHEDRPVRYITDG